MKNDQPTFADDVACWNCVYYAPGDGSNVEQGICRKDPPKASLIIQGGRQITVTIWPSVKNGIDWCGEHPKIKAKSGLVTA